MYIVKLIVKPRNPQKPQDRYKKVCYEGIYLSKDNETKVRHDKIKKKVETAIIADLKKSNPTLQFDYDINIEHNSMDFVLKEDEELSVVNNEMEKS